MKKQLITLVAGSMLALSMLPAHAGVFGSEDNSSSVVKGSARTMNKVLKGTVLQVSEAKIEEATGTKSTGVLAGVAAGASVGANNHGLIGGVIGGIAGGIGGAAVAAFAGSQTAQDVVIQLDNGEVVNITQAVDDKIGAFADGDAVLVVYKGDSARIIRNKQGAKPMAAETAAKPVEAAPATN